MAVNEGAISTPSAWRPISAPWALLCLALRLSAAPNTPSTDAIIASLTARPTGNQHRKKAPVARQAFNSNSFTNLIRDHTHTID